VSVAVPACWKHNLTARWYLIGQVDPLDLRRLRFSDWLLRHCPTLTCTHADRLQYSTQQAALLPATSAVPHHACQTLGLRRLIHT
jgi:hypothetical protein